jgi:hypothetical protein
MAQFRPWHTAHELAHHVYWQHLTSANHSQQTSSCLFQFFILYDLTQQ